MDQPFRLPRGGREGCPCASLQPPAPIRCPSRSLAGPDSPALPQFISKPSQTWF